eukprot:7777199-Alexandrium_andersonii.AAC.1
MPGQLLHLSDKFALVASAGGPPGGPDRRPTVELVPYGPMAEAAELAGRSAVAVAARDYLR